MKKLKLIIGYTLLALAILCLILMMGIWFYMIWTPGYDTRLEGTQSFLLILMFLTGFGGGMALTLK